jgi:hypothetical protein
LNSIGVEPLYPRLCVNTKKEKEKNQNEATLSPSKRTSNTLLNDLSVSMNTLSCGINLSNENICMLPLLMSLVSKLGFLNLQNFFKSFKINL